MSSGKNDPDSCKEVADMEGRSHRKDGGIAYKHIGALTHKALQRTIVR